MICILYFVHLVYFVYFMRVYRKSLSEPGVSLFRVHFFSFVSKQMYNDDGEKY